MTSTSRLLARAALAVPLFALAAIGGLVAWRLAPSLASILARQPNFVGPFETDGVGWLFTAVAAVIAGAAAVAAIGGLAAFLPGRLSLRLVRLGFVACYLAMAAYLVLVTRTVGVIGQHKLTIDELPQDAVTLFKLWWSFAAAVFLPLAMAVIGHVLTWRGSTLALYGGRTADDASAAGDRIIENVRTGGGDPLFRKSWLSSLSGHLLLIVVLPWLVRSIGCSERYSVPHGSGEEAVAAVVQVAKPVKKKKRRYMLNLNSAIILSRPDIDKDSDVEEKVEKASEITYVADANSAQARAGGKMGKGGGKTGGWPDGVGDEPVRFFRIKHAGPGWDDGMDEVSRADMNFLDEFK
ncbi:MAG: hypothetical protein ACKOHG_02595, partial [Planctomycetia bacterium]